MKKLNMILISTILAVAGFGCSTKNDDGARQTTPEQVTRVTPKAFKSRSGECSESFISELNRTSVIEKLRSMNDTLLSQPELDSETIRNFAAEAKTACDQVMGSFGAAFFSNEGVVAPEEVKCDLVAMETGTVVRTFDLARIKTDCDKAADLINTP